MRKLAGFKELLWIIAAFGAVAIVARLIGGLGAATDLSDSVPWGLWKILNMVAGVALATGGFALAATVYIFGLKRYKLVLKPAVLIACLGYGSSCFALFLDIGLPHAIWKPIVYWNHHSFLFEVAWCVMLYFSVTILEVAPTVLEKYGFEKTVSLFHKVTIPLVIVGITLSTLHHTSLGSLFLVAPARLHPLWFTSWIPVLFILSAIGAGIQMVILIMLGYAYFYQRPRDIPMLAGLAKASAAILCVYFVLKVADLVVRGQIATLFSGQWESGFFFVELLLAVIIPVTIVAIRDARNTALGLTLASGSAVLGLVLNRLNVGIVGFLRTADVAYFPTFAELCVSLGVVAMAGLVFLYMIESFRVFEGAPAQDPMLRMGNVRDYDHLGRAWAFSLMTDRARTSLFVAVAVSVAAGLFAGQALEGIALERDPVGPPLAMDDARQDLQIDGNRNGDAVVFKHEEHKGRLGDDKSCRQCHHLDVPGDKSSSCHLCHTDMRNAASIFDHDLHIAEHGDKWSCAECHDPALPKNLENSKDCYECHKDDMNMEPPATGRFNFMADAYMDAMHGRCIECHKQEGPKRGHPEMADCAWCHADNCAEKKEAIGNDNATD